MSRPRIRVAAYVVRQRVVPELLVFDHVDMPEAGTQVPTGGVRAGEGLEMAVLREVAEESGLPAVRVVRRIAVADKPHGRWGGRRPRLPMPFPTLPLPLAHPLADDQDAWLDRVDPGWRTAT
ncbi:NUDIX domain-containing protein [Streptomyces sp. NPDC048290]|uniref:NUDIX domain-containing protein n=1 Tax=Streptomyces sp. NPDC048290 TaxID=3155811 RepID=UPI00341C6D22